MSNIKTWPDSSSLARLLHLDRLPRRPDLLRAALPGHGHLRHRNRPVPDARHDRCYRALPAGHRRRRPAGEHPPANRRIDWHRRVHGGPHPATMPPRPARWAPRSPGCCPPPHHHQPRRILMPFTDPRLAYLASQRQGSHRRLRGRARTTRCPSATTPTWAPSTSAGTPWMSRKFRNIAANPNVALVIDKIASYQPWKVRCVEIRGHAEALTDQPSPMPGFSAEIIRIHPGRILSFGLDDTPPGN